MKNSTSPLAGGEDSFFAPSADQFHWDDSSWAQAAPDSLVPHPIAPLDNFPGTTGNDHLTGTSGDDTFDLTAGGNDTASGLAGDDEFLMGATFNAADKIDGGDGNDFIQLDGTTNQVLTATTMVNIETVQVLAGHNYTLTTNDANIAAGQGLTIDASLLGAGNVLNFNGSAETDGSISVTGGAGNDTITTGAGFDSVNAAHGGNDTINLGGNTPDDSGNDDSVYFGAAFTAADRVDGVNGNAEVDLQGDYSGGVTLGATTLLNVGEIVFASGFSYAITTDDATVAAGQVFVAFAGGLQSTQTLNFDGSAETDGDFVITGGAGNDTLVGGAGDDFFKGKAGDDFIDGGAGKNRVTYSDDGPGVTVSLLQQGHAQATGDGNDNLNNIQDVSGSAGNDVLTGDANANWLWGEGGSDTISGGGGNDLIQVGTLNGALGTDTVDGGGGVNTLSFDDNGTQISGVTFSLALEGSAQATGVDTVTATNFSNVTGTSLDDALTGNATANVLYGAGGSDTLVGGAGNDTLYGDKVYVGGISNTGGDGPTGALDVDPGTGGNDVLMGGAGTDTLDGGEGSDTASYADATGNVFVNLTITTAQAVGGGDGTDTLVSIENLIGGNFNDTLTGDDGDNTLSGGAGNDTFHTGGGNDTVNGGDGNDTVFYDGGGSLIFNGGAGTDTLDAHLVSFNTSWALPGEDEVFIGGSGDDTVGVLDPADVIARNFSGGAGNDILATGAGNDRLDGGAGNDTLDISAGGNDTVTGDANNDIIQAITSPGVTAALTVADHIDGGTGIDTLQLTGDYSAGLTFATATMINVETIQFGAGFTYKLITNDTTVAAGQILTVDGSALGASDVLNFSGVHETDGLFHMIGGAGDDILTGGSGADNFDLSHGGNDTVAGGDGADRFTLGAAFTAADKINGGTGADTIVLNGDYSVGMTLTNSTVVAVETIILTAGFSYALTTGTGNVATGQTLTINGATLGASDLLTFNGSHETTGAFIVTGGADNDVITGGAGNDTLTGGLGNDTIKGGTGADHLTGGGGSDTFVYSSLSESIGTQNGGSAGTGYDTLTAFDMLADKFDLPVTVTAIDATVNNATVSTVTFDTDMGNTLGAAQLGVQHAVLVNVTGGSLAGDTFLVVEGNGMAGYQSAGDFVFLLDHASHIASLSTGDFI